MKDLPAFAATHDLPYVIKSPWSHQMIDQVLANPRIKLDAVLVPIRDLLEAATSRSVVQLQAVHQGAPWMTQTTTWDQWGETPGGAIYSLDPVDQARLLAVGFHRLLEQAARAEIPIVLLSFPKFAVDPDYLFRQLSSVLPVDVSIARAREAHAATFRPAKIRVALQAAPGMRQARSAGEAGGPALHRAGQRSAEARGRAPARRAWRQSWRAAKIHIVAPHRTDPRYFGRHAAVNAQTSETAGREGLARRGIKRGPRTELSPLTI